MTTMIRRHTIIIAIAVLTSFATAPTAGAQTRLTRADALRIGSEKSEAVAAAKAGEVRADAEIQRASSQALPQVSFLGSYDRTLASEFSSALESTGPGCNPLAVNPAAAVADRVAELERAASCGGIGSGLDFSNLPFGQKNVYRGTLAISQALYTGGRISAQKTQARLGRLAAELTTSSAEAQTALEITRAFYDVALSEKLVAIAELAYAQAESAFAQAKLAFDAGRQPEFELLRAQVARDNQRPLVIRRRADREVAMLRLRQLLELPASETIVVDVELDLESGVLAPPAPFAAAVAAQRAAAAAEIGGTRADVKQAETLVGVREAAMKIARAERLPAVSFTSSLGRVGYPSDGVVPLAGDFRTNWTAGATVSVPLFTGYRLRAGEQVARAELIGAQARLKQTRELAELDAATALQDLSAAEAVWEASAGTIQQAERAYQIAELRNREGLSTQLELSDSRLSLQVAQANRAQAARDVQVARARVALLPNLPVGVR